MNDTNNSVDQNGTVASTQTSVPNQQITPPASAPVETSVPTESVAPTSDGAGSATNNVDANDNIEEVGKKEFPFVAIIIAFILVLIILAYYFFYITPTRVFDEAIENIFDNIKNIASGITDSDNETVELDLNGKLKTAGKEYKNVKDISFLNNLKVNANIEVDLKKLDFGVAITSDVKETSNMKYPQNMDMSFDTINNELYFKIGDTIAKYQSNGKLEDALELRYDRIDDAVSIFEAMKDQVVNIITEEQLSKTIATRKINNQTAIAIKAHIILDNKGIASIYYEGFENILKDKNLVKKWANLFAISEEEATKTLERIIDREVVTSNIEVNLYMNLANTQLIGLDIKVDNYYVEINSLNGFYYIDLKVFNDKEKEILDIEVEYDAYHGVLDGIGTANISAKGITAGYLVVKFDYTRISADNSNTMIGNKLDFKFYDDDSGKPFCTLDCTLDLSYNNPVDFLDVSQSVNLLDLDQKELENILTLTDKMTYETLFVVKKLALNRLPSVAADKAVEEIEANVKDKIEKEIINMAEIYLKDLPKEKLMQLIGTPQGQQMLLSKLSFMSNESKQELIKRIGMLKSNITSGKENTTAPVESKPVVKEQTNNSAETVFKAEVLNILKQVIADQGQNLAKGYSITNYNSSSPLATDESAITSKLSIDTKFKYSVGVNSDMMITGATITDGKHCYHVSSNSKDNITYTANISLEKEMTNDCKALLK